MKLTKETLESIIQEELEDLFEEEEELEEEKRPWWDLGYGAGPESDDPRQAAGQPYSKEDPSGDLEGWGSGVISKAPGYFIQKDAERRGRNVGIVENMTRNLSKEHVVSPGRSKKAIFQSGKTKI